MAVPEDVQTLRMGNNPHLVGSMSPICTNNIREENTATGQSTMLDTEKLIAHKTLLYCNGSDGHVINLWVIYLQS
jgi:hypothetical protein